MYTVNVLIELCFISILEILMGDIDILVCNYCEAKITIIVLTTISVLKIIYKCVKLTSTNVSKHSKTYDECKLYYIIVCHDYC